MVSVVMITYNHEKYIAEAIKGVFIQKCDFDIEFIIANDKSIDQTNQVINKIIDETTIADHIKLRYYNHPNNKGMMKNFIWSLQQAKGRYIALCEGDDYWTDPLKLQKQVDFLEANLDYGLSFTNCSVLYEKANVIKESKKPLIDCSSLSRIELFNKIMKKELRIRTPSILIRTSVFKNIKPNTEQFLMGDLPLFLDFAMNAKFHYYKKDTLIYRHRTESASHFKSLLKRLKFQENTWEMRLYYTQKYSNELESWVINQLNKHRIEIKASFPKEKIILLNPGFRYKALFLIIKRLPKFNFLFFRIIRKMKLL